MSVAGAGQIRPGNPDFLIENWLEGDGLPESSAYALAQTPDGYLWVGTSEGVCRYNGFDFTPAGRGLSHGILDGSVEYLYVDHAGRLWASSKLGLGIHENKVWRTIDSTNKLASSMAEDKAGRIWLATFDGRLFNIANDKITPAPTPAGLTPSSVLCMTDRQDGSIWLANQGYVGDWNGHSWIRMGPADSRPNGLMATAARQGGIWVYTPGHLTRYLVDGRQVEFAAPNINQTRLIREDQTGAIWLVTLAHGYFRFQPGRPVDATLNENNGLIQNSTRCWLQDVEGNIWLGGSTSGLSRLRPKIFATFGVENGLPSQIVSTVAEEAPDQLIFGTYGHGKERIQAGKVIPVASKSTDWRLNFVTSIVHDSRGRTWTGTRNGGLWVEENGEQQQLALPATLGNMVNCLVEDSHHRLWVGTSSGLGLIQGGTVLDWGSKCGLPPTSVNCLAEDASSGDVWLGTQDQGICRLDGQHLAHYGGNQGPRGYRVCSMYLDHAGYLWFGIVGEGLACLHGDQITRFGRGQNFPGTVAGSMIEDDQGWLWCDAECGILRARLADLHAIIQGQSAPLDWDIFDASDGLNSAGCFQGVQPAVAHDCTGHLWFATMSGLVGVDPKHMPTNTNPPPVVIEKVVYRDGHGKRHEFDDPTLKLIRLEPGSLDLSVNFAVLSYSAPQQNLSYFRLEGLNTDWVPFGNRHNLYWASLPPGVYELHIKASNNDTTWNDAGVVLSFEMEPYFWQTAWFRLLILLGVGTGGGMAVWQFAHGRLKRRIASLEQLRALERERARLAVVMEATSDLVAFANQDGKLLHLNLAGRRLLGWGETENLTGLNLTGMQAGWAIAGLESEALPAARRQGMWEGETALKHRDGHEIPVMQAIMVHTGPQNGDSFISAIARDLTEQKRVERASNRLRSQLLQAQKMESVGRLAGGIAHDFNNMLQVILGNTDLALAKTVPGGELHGELLEIQKSATRSAELTSQLLTFARKQIYRPQELDLNETVAATARMLQRMIGENVQLVWQPGDNLWLVQLDPLQVTQILTNLAINARDAITSQGRLTITASNVILSPDQTMADADVIPGEFVLLSVQDNGSGMTRKALDNLFEPFYTTKENGKGTGLGLATVFGIVKQNKGMIQVDSIPGQGTTFRLYFPRSITNPMNKTDTPTPPQPVAGTETILVVEDEQNILDLVILILEKNGYRVIGAAAPETALELATRQPGKIDLLVTDVVMPGMNGKELADKLAARQTGMKSIFMSGYTSDIIAQQGCLESGLQFLQKPFTIQSFLEKVRKTLDQH